MRNVFAVTTLMVIALAMVPLSGCGHDLQRGPIEIGELMVRNQTAGPLYHIKLRVEQTGVVISCNLILAGQSFSTEFPRHRYQGNPVRVTWEQNGRVFETGDLYAEIPDTLDLSLPVNAVVEIHDNGTPRVLLEQ